LPNNMMSCHVPEDSVYQQCCGNFKSHLM
jgi:hypothetical protein